VYWCIVSTELVDDLCRSPTYDGLGMYLRCGRLKMSTSFLQRNLLENDLLGG
jgi:hypothetical protein